MKSKLIELLKTALAREYSDVFLYTREAKTIDDPVLAKRFEEFGLTEIRHADMLSTKLLEAGEKPVWNFVLLKSGAAIKEVLEYHIGKEREIVFLYNDCISAADDENLKIILNGIKANEESHAKYLEEVLKKII